MNMSIRSLAERLARNRVLRRRLPAAFGNRPIWVSPDARLRYLKPGSGGFDAELLAVVQRYLHPGDVVIDIGANIGELSLAAAHRVGSGGAILAVEPDPFLGHLIQSTRIEPENQDVNYAQISVALAGQRGVSRFLISARGRASNALEQCGDIDMGGSRHELMVAVTPLDELVAAWKPPTFVKIDVEGAELAVLSGGLRTLSEHRPTVLIEVRKDRTEVRDLFHRHGYRLFDPRVGLAGEPLAECTYDTLAVHSSRLADLRNRQS